MLVFEFDSKHGIGERFDHRRHYFDGVFFPASLVRFLFFLQRLPCHALLLNLVRCDYQHGPVASLGRVKIHGPLFVTATVCSKWAESLPSAVTAVQSSSRTRTPGPPEFTIGSMAITMPS